MILLIVFSILLSAFSGLAIKSILNWRMSPYEVTWKEFAIGLLIISIVVAPLTAVIGWNVAKSNKLSFQEYWNGWELAANQSRQSCTRDGTCRYEYECDPYEEVRTRTVTDSKGNSRVETYTVTLYHQCPYATEEWSFSINTTLGVYDIGTTIPSYESRWRAGADIPRNIPEGIPALWKAAEERLSQNRPGPVTKKMKYNNWILASDSSILKSYSDRIATFRKAKLLPDVQSGIRDHYYADKVHFVGAKADPKWSTQLMYLNAALGTQLQGDLHMVITNNRRISQSPDGYITALKAYWSNPERFGDDTISKNAIIVVIGQEGEKISWARAVTGMPLGNELMLQTIESELKGVDLSVEKVLGATHSILKGKPQHQFGEGVLERTLFGLDNPGTKFKRVSMTGEDKDDVGTGFKYLDAQIQPSKGQRSVMYIVIFLLTSVVWGIMSINGEREQQ